MRVTILDTNILRSLSDEPFARINEREIKLGIRQFADPWTLMELIVHLHSIDDKAYGSCRSALRRCAERALAPLTEQPRVVEPAELKVSRTVFGEALPCLEENFAALVQLSRSIAFSESADDLAIFDEKIKSIAQHVEEKEWWFAQYFGTLRATLSKAAESCTISERNEVIRSFTRSAKFLQLDAITLVNRAYCHADRQPPNPLPLDLIDRVLATAQYSSAAVGLLLEKIICDNVNLKKLHIRNLLWDQEVAGSMGQTIEGLPVLLVTDDKYFAKTAEVSGNKAAVCTYKEYLSQLGLKDH